MSEAYLLFRQHHRRNEGFVHKKRGEQRARSRRQIPTVWSRDEAAESALVVLCVESHARRVRLLNERRGAKDGAESHEERVREQEESGHWDTLIFEWQTHTLIPMAALFLLSLLLAKPHD